MSARHRKSEGPAEKHSREDRSREDHSHSSLGEPILSEAAATTAELEPIYTDKERLKLPELERAVTALAVEIQQKRQRSRQLAEGSAEREDKENELARREFQLCLQAGSYVDLLSREEVIQTSQAVEGMRLILELIRYVPDNENFIRGVIYLYGGYREQGGGGEGLSELLSEVLQLTRVEAKRRVTEQVDAPWPIAMFSTANKYPSLLEEAQEPRLAAHWAWQNLVDIMEQRFFEGWGRLPAAGEVEHFLREQGLDPATATDPETFDDVFARLRSFNSCYDAGKPVRGGENRVLARERTAELYRQWQHEVGSKRRAA